MALKVYVVARPDWNYDEETEWTVLAEGVGQAKQVVRQRLARQGGEVGDPDCYLTAKVKHLDGPPRIVHTTFQPG